MKPELWVGDFGALALLRPFGWCWLLSPRTQMWWRSGSCAQLWTVTDPSHSAAFTPEGPEHRGSELGMAVLLLYGPRGGHPRVGVQLPALHAWH